MDKTTLEYGLQFKTAAERLAWAASLSTDEQQVILDKLRAALHPIIEWWQEFQDAYQAALLEMGK